jgi:hypothetical protein
VNRHVGEFTRERAIDARLDLLANRLAARLDEAQELVGTLSHGPVIVSREHTAKTWIDLLWGCSARFWGTIHTAPQEAVGTSLFAESTDACNQRSPQDQRLISISSAIGVACLCA